MPQIDGPRACMKREIPEMIKLVDDAMRAGTDQTMWKDYPLVYDGQNLENVRVLRADGEMASVVPFILRPVVIDGCRFTMGIISPTATAPHHRMKGYGMRCLKSSVEKMTRDGCDISVLWTDIETFPFYEKAGYQAVRSQGWLYNCRREDAELFQDHDEEIVEYNPQSKQYLNAIQQMHEQDIYGVLRTPEEYAPLFSLPKMKTLIALRGKLPAGYLVVSRAINKPGLIEAGGDEAAVETLVHQAVLQLKGDNQWLVPVNLTKTALGILFEKRLPDRKQPATQSMMVRINNVTGFLNNIAGWLERKNDRASREFSVSVADTGELVGFQFSNAGLRLTGDKFSEHMDLSRQELTALIFGAHRVRTEVAFNATEGLFPFYFPIWVLDRS